MALPLCLIQKLAVVPLLIAAWCPSLLGCTAPSPGLPGIRPAAERWWGGAAVGQSRLAGCTRRRCVRPRLKGWEVPLRLRGGALEVSWRPAPLQKTRPWLEATTFDGSEASSRFDAMWDKGNSSNDVLLHMAAELGDAAAVARLVDNGTDVDCENLSGQTPLMKAAMMGHESLQCLSTLLRCGADVLKTDECGQTAADWARQSIELECECEEALGLLEQAEAIAEAARAGTLVDGGREEDEEEEGELVRKAAQGAAEATGKQGGSLHEDLDEEDASFAEKQKQDSIKVIEALRVSSQGQVPMSMEEYMEVAAMQSAQSKREEEDKEAEMRDRLQDADVVGGIDGLKPGKKHVPNKSRYKNVRDRWAKLKARKKARKEEAKGT